MKYSYVLLVPVAAVIVGCASPAPIAQNFPVSYQKVARTAHHWNVVADDVARRTMESMVKSPLLQGRRLVVAPARSTAFNTAFREFMITRLVDAGAQVSVCRSVQMPTQGFQHSGPEFEVHYDTQLVVHGADVPNYLPGRWTALAAGVAVIRNAWFDNETNAALLAAGALADFGLGHAASPTRTEIIVTTSIMEQNRFIARTSDIYYVPDGDAALFIKKVAQRSRCDDDGPSKTADLKLSETEGVADSAEREIARKEMFERSMMRSNPQWRRSGAQMGAYSY